MEEVINGISKLKIRENIIYGVEIPLESLMCIEINVLKPSEYNKGQEMKKGENTMTFFDCGSLDRFKYIFNVWEGEDWKNVKCYIGVVGKEKVIDKEKVAKRIKSIAKRLGVYV